ncbi:MAG: HAMP domain-containing histidine kinase [Phycisphaerae bacterium]|nr:HAMP domain-containing histidine kinase [Phycisphaerae bacterium]
MSRPWHIWTIFSLCAAVGLAAMIWLTTMVLRLDRDTARAWQRTDDEANTRVALWRTDSALVPLIARESARPYFVYSSFYPVERAYTRMFNKLEQDVLMPSPLLTQVSPYIRLHFQIDADGVFTSPQVPEGDMRALAEPDYASGEDIQTAAAWLNELRAIVDRAALSAALPLETKKPVEVVLAPPSGRGNYENRHQQRQTPMQQAEQTQTFRNIQETQARARAFQSSNAPADNVWNETNWFTDVTEGPLTPIWNDKALLLARRVSVNGAEYVQGCWLDWSAIENWLGSGIADIFPQARFEPLLETAGDNGGRALAALPVRFEPGPSALELAAVGSPVKIFLIIAWGCVLLAALAVVILLFGTISLSERRGAFVSAVTHELRTPLTTFRLYTDLLVDGIVRDEDKKRRYLKTLHAEASRLGHLVENVLAYARLERGRAGARVESIPLSELLYQVRDRLTDRAAQAGMTLSIEPLSQPLAEVYVHAAASQVDQILFNLVDNACKYAAAADTKQIHITAERRGETLSLRVRDHGPGIPPGEVDRLFQPFHKSAREAAHSAPGVGLGLALSRRLARGMGGDLRQIQTAGDGACFELVLRSKSL